VRNHSYTYTAFLRTTAVMTSRPVPWLVGCGS